MSPITVATPAYHLGILKGYLLAQNAPAEVFAAAEALHMAAREPLPGDERINDPGPAKIDLLTIKEPGSEAADAQGEPASDDRGEAKPERAAGDIQHGIVGATASKTRKPWSPEAREAAAERMKAMRASGVIKGRAKSEAGTEGAVSGKPFIEVTVDKLQTVHDGYAGRRDPGQELIETDWPDIQNMLEKQRRSVSQIASDYDVEFATMRQFIDRHLWDGKPPPGEARASSR